MQLSLWSLLLMAVASCFSTWIVRLFSRQHSLPGFTAPFIFFCVDIIGNLYLDNAGFMLVSETVSDTVREVDYVQAFLFRYWSGHVSRKFIDRTVLFGWYWG